MSTLTKKIDFALILSVTNANPNGDPLGGNRPRTDYEGYGEISDVCIKRKIRNRMQDIGHDMGQDMGYKIFVQSDDRCDDGCKTLKERADKEIGTKEQKKKKEKTESNGLTKEKYAETACEKFIDVRSFGQVFAFGKVKNDEQGGEGSEGVSVGIRGPVSVCQAKSVSPVDIQSMQITKSVSGDKEDGKEKGKDTMGMKHFVRFGLYSVKGSVNVQLAEKTGFSEKDATILKECLSTLFVNDSSAARPDGSMEVIKLYWWEHNCKNGQYSSARVHRLVKVALKDGVSEPKSAQDYEISVDALPNLNCEEIDGV